MTTLQNISRETLDRILSAGILAPSADNNHLFRFLVLQDRIQVIASAAYRAGSAQTQLLAWISYGATVENMLIQARACGWSSATAWFPKDDVVCEIRLIAPAAPPDGLSDAIALRHTNRRFFSGPKLQPEAQADLERELAGADGVRLVWLDGPGSRRTASRLIRLAESERFRSPALHAEMFSSLVFDGGYKASCEQGIPIGAAEIEPPARPFFRLMSSWPAMRVLNAVHAYWLIGWRAAYFPARLSPHLGLVVADGDLRTAAIQTGRGFERLWLRATQLGLALQPMAAGPLYALSQFEGVSAGVREELKTGWARFVPSGTPLMLFRLGHAAAPSVVAGRPPLPNFLQTS